MRKLSPEDVTHLHQELLALVKAQVPLPEGLQAFVTSLDEGALRETATRVAAALEQGQPLSDALAAERGLPPTYQALLAAGEASGDLVAALEGLVQQAETDAQFQRRVHDALLYPALSLAFAVVLGTLALTQVPRIGELLRGFGIQLPWLTRAVLALGDAAREAWPVLIAGGLGIAWTLPRWLDWPGRLLVWPFVHHDLRWRQLAGLSRSLAAFVHRGVPLANALTALRLAEVPYLPREQLQRIEDRLVGGATLGAALEPEKAVFPPTYVWRVSAAERQGNLGDALLSLARRYEDRMRQRMALIAGLAVPLALIVVAAFAALTILGIFLPIFELQKALQQ